MTTLQEYLNQKYPTTQEKEAVTKIATADITELLTGGELDLTAFTNLEKLELDPNLLTTPLTKINTEGLINLKEIDWLETKKESEVEKKLYEELGIASDLPKKKVVQEVQRLVEIKKITVNFKEKVQGEIFLSLDQKDKQDNFCPSLVFWNLTQELTLMDIGGGENAKTPQFWKQFEQEQLWVKENLEGSYQKEFELLLNPSTFPQQKLESKEFFTIYYPNSTEIVDRESKEITIDQAIVNETWATMQKEILALIDQELSKNPSEEEAKKLAINLQLESSANQQYTIQAIYHVQIPFKEQIAKLLALTPLQLENELLKQEKAQLPTPENFTKLTKQVALLESYFSEEELDRIKEKIAKIK